MRRRFNWALFLLSLLVLVALVTQRPVPEQDVTAASSGPETITSLAPRQRDRVPRIPAPTTTTTTTTTTIPPTTTTAPPPPPTTTPSPTPAAGSGTLGDPEYIGSWDALAGCESNHTWNINTGNGYYGGLQFALSSWQWVGGSGYPHEHSREEQIKRGKMLYYKMGGWSPWPHCTREVLGWR